MPGSRFHATSAKALVGVAIAIAAIVLASVFIVQTPGASRSTSSATSTTVDSGSQPSIPVHDAVNQFFQDFNDRNIYDLIQFYYSGANVIWSGNAPGLTGGYSGTYAIQILYGSTLGKITQMTSSIDNYTQKSASPLNVNVTVTLKLNGTSSTVGRLNGTIYVSQQWAYSGGQWEIVRENWVYKTFNVQFPSSATTFPQWGVMREGKSPDLVSEKSLEWNAGPFLAAGVYAFLFVVLLLYVRRGKSRT